jgi:hypothetical protein
MQSKSLYEILVPTQSNEGKPYRTRYHKVWDAKVREISGGLTILTPAKGQWVSQDGKIYAERMIPVRIICTKEEIEKIIEFSMKYYEQLAILAYEISNNVILRHKEEYEKEKTKKRG